VFSQRSGRSRAPHALAEKLASLSPPRLDLCGHNPTAAGIHYPAGLLGAVQASVASSAAYRPEALGLSTARAALAQFFARSRGVAPPPAEDIVLTASTSEAYAFLFKLLCDPGDEVLVPAPSYPLFEHLAELEGVRAVPYRLAYDGAWHVDLSSLETAVTRRARAVIVVSPNNPTGHYTSAEELSRLARFGLPLLSDEVFFEYPLDASAPREHDARPDVLLFRMGGLSKLAGLPQLKLAWTVLEGPLDARREARERLELIADTFLSVGSAVQLALPQILELAPSVTAAIGARCRHNLAALRELTRDSPVSVLRTEGGWSAALRVPDVVSEDLLVAGLAEREGVLVQPGWFYDFETPGVLVVSLLTEPGVLREGAERLTAYVTKTSA
jgi:alanine-synthesizing transaminase